MSGITPAKSKAQIWRERIGEQVRSGKSVRAFCEERLIGLHIFHYWKRKFCRLRPPRAPLRGRERTIGRFIAVTGRSHLAGAFSRIHLPNGVRIELGAGLESGAVTRFLLGLCGVGHPPEDGHRAKP